MAEQHEALSVETKANTQIRSFTPNEVRSVNRLFKIGDVKQLSEEQYPPTLNLSKWWKEVAPIVAQKPKDIEVGIGWNLKNGKLVIDQIVDGIPFNQIKQDNLELKLIGGNVRINKNTLMMFHTHPEINEEIRKFLEKDDNKSNEVKKSIDDIPDSSFSDIFGFLYNPRTYLDVICDISKRKKGLTPVLVAIKTINTPIINNENRFDYYIVMKNILRREFFGSSYESYNDILKFDLNWQRNFGIVFYRGYLSENTDEPQFVRKSDIRLRKSPSEYMGRKGFLIRMDELLHGK